MKGAKKFINFRRRKAKLREDDISRFKNDTRRADENDMDMAGIIRNCSGELWG